MNPESIERIGQYRVRRFIASGENADVFEVTDSRFEGQVVRALKLLKPDLSGPKFDRFRADASLLATLDHPNLVTIFDFGLDEATGRHYYAMTYVDGPSLAEQIEANGPLPAGRCIEVFSAVLSGLAELHSHDPAIVHRAIKPSNVLSHSNGHIRLADLGISRADEDTQVTRASPTHGSVRFMSPEQIRGEVVDVRSDIFSVGLAMYEALTGHSPYEHIEGVDPTNDFDIVGCLAACERSGGELDIPAEHMQFPGELAAIIRRALRIAPDARYPDARSMHDALVAATASVDTTLHLSLPRASVNPHEIRQIGHYTIRRFIDEGGMAWVFEVVDSHFKGHEVIRALKLLKPDAAAGAEFQRFQSEAALLAGFDHPNLVTIFEFGQDEQSGCFFYTMTYVDGTNLAHQIAQHGPLEEKRAIEVFSSVLSGLAELHSHPRRIVHRDIKPANVLIHADGHIRLADLGIARAEDSARNTRTGFAVGTVRYMSPEQARGRTVDPASDVFAVGLAFYEALVSRNVYEGLDGIDSTSDFDVLGYLAMCGRSGGELEIDLDHSRISPALAAVIRKACRYEPRDRYADAAEMRAALLAASAPADVVESKREPQPPVRRGIDARWIAAAAAAVLALAIGSWIAWPSGREKVTRDIERASETLESLPALRKQAVALGADVSPELDQRLDAATARAIRILRHAEQSLAADELRTARIRAQDVGEELAAVCAEIDASLPEDTQALATRLDERIAQIRQLDATQNTAAARAALEERVDALAALPTTAAAGCESTRLRFERHAILAPATAAADALEGELQALFPPKLSAAREAMESARADAIAQRIQSGSFERPFEAAEKAAADARRAQSVGDPQAELDAYERATESYARAAAVAPAVAIRRELADLEGRLAGRPVPTEIAALIASAERHFDAQETAPALDAYRDAISRLQAHLNAESARPAAAGAGATKQASEATTAPLETDATPEPAEPRQIARELRESALRAGADRLAQSAFERAEAEYEAGTTARYAKNFDDANVHYRNAIPAYQHALEQATAPQPASQPAARVSREVAEDAQREALRWQEQAYNAGAQSRAADPLTSAELAYNRGARALTGGRYGEASEEFSTAQAGFAAAVEAARAVVEPPAEPDPILAAALRELDALRSELRFCDDFKAPESVSQCNLARVELARAVASADGAAAKQAFSHITEARSALKKAIRAEMAGAPQ